MLDCLNQLIASFLGRLSQFQLVLKDICITEACSSFASGKPFDYVAKLRMQRS
jgi:hypothetical protein